MTQLLQEGMVTEFEPLSPASPPGPAGGIETPNQPRGSDTMGTMSNDETYNGYANRETWAFNLHWQNDQGLYNETLDAARQWMKDYPLIAEADLTGSLLGEAVVAYWRDVIDSYEEEFDYRKLPDEFRMFDRGVGSWWRIDYAEVGAAVRESLSAEGE